MAGAGRVGHWLVVWLWPWLSPARVWAVRLPVAGAGRVGHGLVVWLWRWLSPAWTLGGGLLHWRRVLASWSCRVWWSLAGDLPMALAVTGSGMGKALAGGWCWGVLVTGWWSGYGLGVTGLDMGKALAGGWRWACWALAGGLAGGLAVALAVTGSGMGKALAGGVKDNFKSPAYF
ncbi:hypothetical protein EHS17_14350 [Rhodobacteraceae bacterium CH30]|nr:hypothetical protein EHS17_14350 [Rhodobacteraceae bacterium CH30]